MKSVTFKEGMRCEGCARCARTIQKVVGSEPGAAAAPMNAGK